ncbi:MAG: ribulose-phosphate 3-epimerase [Patescibacteria group bacterium]|nr:ribulose-phosphate 3-epimerase [Patescibacteria group bacterium]
MIQIIPTIIAKDFQELQDKINKVELHAEWAQLDVMDGKFVNNTTWQNPVDLKNLETNLNLEAHLMVKNPEEVIDQWIESGVKRIIIHYESTKKITEIIDKIKKAGLEVGLAINPETSLEKIVDFIEKIDLVLIMTVNPGFGGQDFLNESVDKIKQLRGEYKDVNIEVDGGINLKTASKVIQAGANFLAVGTAIFKSDNIKEVINKFKNINIWA